MDIDLAVRGEPSTFFLPSIYQVPVVHNFTSLGLFALADYRAEKVSDIFSEKTIYEKTSKFSASFFGLDDSTSNGRRFCMAASRDTLRPSLVGGSGLRHGGRCPLAASNN
jgi:hypothetical protein